MSSREEVIERLLAMLESNKPLLEGLTSLTVSNRVTTFNGQLFAATPLNEQISHDNTVILIQNPSDGKPKYFYPNKFSSARTFGNIFRFRQSSGRILFSGEGVNFPFRYIARDFDDDPNNQYVYGGNQITTNTDMESTPRFDLAYLENLDNSSDTGFVFVAYDNNPFQWQWYLEGVESTVYEANVIWTEYLLPEFGNTTSNFRADFYLPGNPDFSIRFHGYNHIVLTNYLNPSFGLYPDFEIDIDTTITTNEDRNCGFNLDPGADTCLLGFFTIDDVVFLSATYQTIDMQGIDRDIPVVVNNNIDFVHYRFLQDVEESRTTNVFGVVYTYTYDLFSKNDWLTMTTIFNGTQPYECNTESKLTSTLRPFKPFDTNSSATGDYSGSIEVIEEVTAPLDYVYNDQVIVGTFTYETEYRFVVSATNSADWHHYFTNCTAFFVNFEGWSASATENIDMTSDFNMTIDDFVWTKSSDIVSEIYICDGLTKTTQISTTTSSTLIYSIFNFQDFANFRSSIFPDSLDLLTYMDVDWRMEWTINHVRLEYLPLREYKEVAIYSQRQFDCDVEYFRDFDSTVGGEQRQSFGPSQDPDYDGAFLNAAVEFGTYYGYRDTTSPGSPVVRTPVNEEEWKFIFPDVYHLYEERLFNKITMSDDRINTANSWWRFFNFSEGSAAHLDMIADFEAGVPFSRPTGFFLSGVFSEDSYTGRAAYREIAVAPTSFVFAPDGATVRTPFEDYFTTPGSFPIYYLFRSNNPDVLYYGEGVANVTLISDPAFAEEDISSELTDIFGCYNLRLADHEGERLHIPSGPPLFCRQFRPSSNARAYDYQIDFTTINTRESVLGYHNWDTGNAAVGDAGVLHFSGSTTLEIWGRENVWMRIREYVLGELALNEGFSGSVYAGKAPGFITPGFTTGADRQVNPSLRYRAEDGKVVLYIPPFLEFGAWDGGFNQLNNIPMDSYVFDPATGNWQPDGEFTDNYTHSGIDGNVSNLRHMGAYGSFGDIVPPPTP